MGAQRLFLKQNLGEKMALGLVALLAVFSDA
jgi:hypothetical protein